VPQHSPGGRGDRRTRRRLPRRFSPPSAPGQRGVGQALVDRGAPIAGSRTVSSGGVNEEPAMVRRGLHDPARRQPRRRRSDSSRAIRSSPAADPPGQEAVLRSRDERRPAPR